MKIRTVITACFLVQPLVLSTLFVGCGAKTSQDGAVTETGNPSLIDETRIAASPLEGVVSVQGSKGAVPAGAKVEATNQRTGETVEVTADKNGAFSLRVEGEAKDALEVVVSSDGKTDEVRISVPTPQAPVPEKHRAERTSCDDTRPPGDADTLMFEIFSGDCTKDADCTDGVRGRCHNLRGYAACSYDQCESDGACNTGGPCECNPNYRADNQCLGGNCQLDSQCGSGGYCSPTLSTCGSGLGLVAYYCHTPEDECTNDSDCTQEGDGYCMYSTTVSHWLCAYTVCAG